MKKKSLYFVVPLGFTLALLAYFFVWDIKTIEKILSRHQYLSCKGTYWSNLDSDDADKHRKQEQYLTSVIIEYPRFPYINYMIRTEFGLAFGLHDFTQASDDISPYFFYNDDNKVQFQHGYIDVKLDKVTKNIKISTYNRGDYGYNYNDINSMFEGKCEETNPL